MTSIKALFKYDDALWPTAIATGYAVLAWGGGLAALIAFDHPLVLAAATLLLAHGMVIAAYMMHECGHNAVFKKARHNALLGRFLNWLTGSCYNSFERIRSKHMHHHVDNADIVAFDYRGFLLSHPVLLRVTRALEWAYIPATELLMHSMMMLTPFIWPSRKDERSRVVVAALVRGGAFAALIGFAPVAAVLYAVAYMLFITVLRFMDAFQHNYELMASLDEGGGSPRKGDKDYEQTHTFSNPVSLKYPWMNWVTLNFAYHNAHHEKPTVPWYRLPELHDRLFGDDDTQVVAFSKQLLAFHRNRIPRILSLEDESEDFREKMAHGDGVGANGVSFLTAL